MRKFKYILLGAAVGMIVSIMAYDVAYPACDPSIWRVYAEATGVCQPSSVVPVVWGYLVEMGVSPLRTSMLAVGLLAFAMFDVFWRLLTVVVCPDRERHNWWRLSIPLLAYVASVLSVFSEPVWRLALSGSPAVLTLALFVLAFDLYLVSFFTVVIYDYDGTPIGSLGQNFGRCAAFLLSGLLVGETPVALVLPFAFAFIRRSVVRRVKANLYDEHPSEMLVFTPMRVSVLISCAFWLVGLALAVMFSGLPGHADLVRHQLAGTVREALGAATPIGWILWVACAAVPFALVSRWLPVLTGNGGRLKSGMGVAVLLFGVVTLALLSPLPHRVLAFVEISSSVRSPFMQALGAVLVAMSAAQALAVAAYFAFHRPLRDFAARQAATFVTCAALAAALAVAGLGVRRGEARQVRLAIADAMDEVARETKGLKWLFTDGTVDLGIALEARQHGQRLNVRPLVSDEATAQLGDWISGGSSNLQVCAAQDGFDLWTRAGKRPPQASGLLVREGWPANAREYGIVFADRLRERMTELSRAGAPDREVDPSVRGAFAAVLGQLSRMARQRGAAECDGK